MHGTHVHTHAHARTHSSAHSYTYNHTFTHALICTDFHIHRESWVTLKPMMLRGRGQVCYNSALLKHYRLTMILVLSNVRAFYIFNALILFCCVCLLLSLLYIYSECNLFTYMQKVCIFTNSKCKHSLSQTSCTGLYSAARWRQRGGGVRFLHRLAPLTPI